ncbi:2Fe-2S iron-sulfur cluster-binding protein [Spirillospora sp. CA-255316]
MPDPEAVTVTVLPRGVTVSVDPGQSVYEAAVEQDVRWPTTCEGMGTCHLCFMSVIEGAEHLDPVEPYEAEGLAEVVDRGGKGPLRLACQVRPRRDLVVFKRGVRASA